MTFHTKMFIDGTWTEAADGGVDQVHAPTTGEAFAEIARGGAADVDRAVAAAEAAFPDWARTPVGERARAFLTLADRVEADQRTLAEIESRNVGKPIGLALRGDGDDPRPPPVLRGRRPHHGGPRRGRVRRAARPASSGATRSASSARSPRGTTRC